MSMRSLLVRCRTAERLILGARPEHLLRIRTSAFFKQIPARTSTVTPCQVAPDPGKFDTALSLPQDKEGELRATVEPPHQSASVGDDPLVQHHPPAEAATATVRAAEAQALNVDSSPEQINLSTASSEDPRSATPVPKEEVKASSQQPDGSMEKPGDGDKKASEVAVAAQVCVLIKQESILVDIACLPSSEGGPNVSVFNAFGTMIWFFHYFL